LTQISGPVRLSGFLDPGFRLLPSEAVAHETEDALQDLCTTGLPDFSWCKKQNWEKITKMAEKIPN
jgi:hypothetical protein